MRTPPRILSAALLIMAAGFGVIESYTIVHTIQVYANWAAVDAVVTRIEPTHADRYGSIVWIQFLYDGTFGKRAVWSRPKTWRLTEFTEEYAVGTRHVIRLDPSHPGNAQIQLRAEEIFPLLIMGVICIGLTLASRYYWRLHA
jgi:hypothetical protein